MNKRYFFYALCVTLVTTFASWMSLFDDAGNSSGGGRHGSSWSSGSYSGSGSHGGGYSGGGHK